MGPKNRCVVVLVACLATPAGAAAAGFDNPLSKDTSQQFGTPAANVQRQDTPNDPGYDSSEPAPTDDPLALPTTTNLFEERFDLFGFPSALTTLTARYLDPADPNVGKPQVSGFNAAGAWKASRGLASVNVAILDTGIKWNDASGLRTKVALNEKELVAPQGVPVGAPVTAWDVNGSGALDVDDYAGDTRIPLTRRGAPTGEDLITAFSDHTDADGNGYVDDIAGWDFFDDDNDPLDKSSYFAASNHGTGRTNEVAEKANDRSGTLGVCPRCTFTPLRIWDTFVSDQNSFAMAVTYAADNGVEVIEGADGGLYHSAFAEAASQYAYGKGVAQLFSGDDLNTGNHNFPAAYDHVQLVQGVVADNEGLGMELPAQNGDPGIRSGIIALLRAAGVGTNAPVGTYFRGANTTQFGGKSSISMHGPTGSTNTGKAAGAAALLISAAREQGIRLSPDETRELLEQTAEDVRMGNTGGTGTPDPAQPGFDTHFGYGRANVGAAVGAAVSSSPSRIPPTASLSAQGLAGSGPASPTWYAPVTGATVAMRGLADDPRHAGAFTWRLEYGIGLAPTTFTTAGTGTSTSPVTDFGTLDLAAVRAALAARLTHPDRDDQAGPVLDPSRTDPYTGQFTVRLVVTSGTSGALVGMDRKVLTALDDPTLRGAPRNLGSGGEAPVRYADLDGDGVQELVLPTEDGVVHATRRDGSALPGWPVRTQTQFVARAHSGAAALGILSAPREAPRAPAIGDLDGDGRPEVVTAAGERIYAWHADGTPVGGFPVNPDPARANCAPDQQSQPLKHPKCGFLASPALARLDGPTAPLSIVVPGLDGRLRAYRADGTVQPGFPVALVDPSVPVAEQITAESINAPAIGDLDGDGRDDIVAPSNEVYGGAAGGSDVSFGGAVSASGAGSSSRVYAVSAKGTGAGNGGFLPGWPVKLPGIIQNVLPLIGPGHDPSLVRVGGTQQVVVSTTGGSLSLFAADGTKTRDIQQNGAPGEGSLNLFESAAVGDVDGGGSPDVVKYQVDLGQAANLLLVGQNVPYSHRIGAFDAASGASRPGFPVITDDYQFLSSSTVAKVAPGTANQVVAGTGLGLLHAYDGTTGRDVTGFPKVTGGWLFAPAAISDDGRMAAITREGYLYEWDVPGAAACQPEWPSFRHDQQGTGNYDTDGTPPAAAGDLAVVTGAAGKMKVTFTSPGDDGRCGTATRYVADVDGRAADLGAPVAGGAPYSREVTLPAGSTLTVRAADGAADARSNLGAPASASLPAGSGTEPGGSGGTGTGTGSAGSGTGSTGTGAGSTGTGAGSTGTGAGAGPGAGAGAGTNTPAGTGAGSGTVPGAGVGTGTGTGTGGTTPPRVCASRRSVTITLPRAIRRHGVRSVLVSVTHRKARTLQGSRARVSISLRGLPRGRVAVRLTVRGRDGRRRVVRRSYLTCAGAA